MRYPQSSTVSAVRRGRLRLAVGACASPAAVFRHRSTGSPWARRGTEEGATGVTMGAPNQVVEVEAERETARPRKIRHVYECTTGSPPGPGAMALCGHVYRTSRASVVMRAVTADHCVVCLDLARGKGYAV